MPYDEELTSRLRDALGGVEGVVEKRMMGAVCFMVDGHMVGGAKQEKSGLRRFMFRVGKENMAKALKDPAARPVRIGERQLGGFIHVDNDDCDDAALRNWVATCLNFVGTLPAKE